jgi:integrase
MFEPAERLSSAEAPTRAIQELAGHAELGTTQRYMHLSPAALDSAIRLLDAESFGDILETGGGAIAKSSR